MEKSPLRQFLELIAELHKEMEFEDTDKDAEARCEQIRDKGDEFWLKLDDTQQMLARHFSEHLYLVTDDHVAEILEKYDELGVLHIKQKSESQNIRDLLSKEKLAAWDARVEEIKTGDSL